MKMILGAVLFLFSAQAFAGDAGCGLGSMIISKNSKGLQLFAMTTNGTFSSQFFGITSGTSNCSASGIVMNEKEVQYFVEVNQKELSREMAQGHGQLLATLAEMKGCSNSQAQAAFGSFTQGSYTNIIPAANTTASEMVSNLNNELAGQKDLQSLCHGS